MIVVHIGLYIMPQYHRSPQVCCSCRINYNENFIRYNYAVLPDDRDYPLLCQSINLVETKGQLQVKMRAGWRCSLMSGTGKTWRRQEACKISLYWMCQWCALGEILILNGSWGKRFVRVVILFNSSRYTLETFQGQWKPTCTNWAQSTHEYYWWLTWLELTIDSYDAIENVVHRDNRNGFNWIIGLYRTDGGEGGDCLHLCSPGMTDYSNWLAAHALIQEREWLVGYSCNSRSFSSISSISLCNLLNLLAC